MVKAGQPAPPKVRYRRSLMRYLVAIHHPDDYDPSVAEGEAGGFWVLEAATLDEALAWGRKAVVACRAPVEVRAFN